MDDDEIVRKIQKRYDEGVAAESDFRERFNNDMEFLFADPDNGNQWPVTVKTARNLSQRPMLTINKVLTHWLHVTNEMKENRPTIKIRPTSSSATFQAAQAFTGVIRHIEYQSNANVAYQTAGETLVGGGVGYWRLKTDYVNDDTFDQDVFIEPVYDPLTVVMDPSAIKRDGSDANWCVIYELLTKDEFEDKYPQASLSRNYDEKSHWYNGDSVRVAEYFEKVTKKEWLYAITDPDTGEVKYIRASEQGADLAAAIAERFKQGDDNIDRRRVTATTIKWYKIAGNEVIDRGEWLGKYIPVIRIIALEFRQDGKIDRKGLPRGMKDAQRMYNYNASASVEYGALQTKAPWVAAVEAIRGHEHAWATANVANPAYLPYNGLAQDGTVPVDAPQRPQPPSVAPAYIQGMQDAERQMMMSSGQYEATFSEQGNEISGKAIIERKTQGNRVTFHYLNALAEGIRFTGVQLIDLIPRLYDTKRVVHIMDEAGTEQTIQVDPQSQQAVQQQEDVEEAQAQTIFNPNVGTYDVQATVGPNYETRRQEAFDNMTALITANPALAQVIGDIWINAADFPAANELADRLRNWIPQQILTGGPSDNEQQLQQQLQQLQSQLKTMVDELNSKNQELKIAKQRADTDFLNHLAVRMDKNRDANIKAYTAETQRMQALGLTPETLGAVMPIVTQLIAEMLDGPDINPPQDESAPSPSPLTMGADTVLNGSETPTQ